MMLLLQSCDIGDCCVLSYATAATGVLEKGKGDDCGSDNYRKFW